METSKEHAAAGLSRAKAYSLLALGCILVVASVVSFLVDPVFLMIKYTTRISVGSQIYNRYLIENPGARIELYIFNVTNANTFLSGEDDKLKLQEVGPFNYQEYRVNEGFEVDEDAGVMRYTPKSRTEFVPEFSIGDPNLINVTVPNASFLSISSMMSSYFFFTKTAFNVLVNNLQSQPIVNISVQKFLWGYEEPLIALSHTLLPGWVHFKTLGLLDRLYDVSEVPVHEVSVKDEDKFKVKGINGYNGINALGYDNPSKRTRCNAFEDAYEGYAFFPGITKHDKIRLYRSVFCRMLDLDFVEVSSTDFSPNVFVYSISNSTFSINANNECLCAHSCVDGVSTMAPCLYDLGIGLSNGHFLYGDPKIYKRVEGIHPSVEKHGSRIVIDPRIGVVISTSFTLQVNILMEDVSFNNKAKPFSNMVVPLAYFRIISDIDEDDKNNVRAAHYLYPYIMHGMECLIFGSGLIILAYAICRTRRCFSSDSLKKQVIDVKLVQQDMPLMDLKDQNCKLNIDRL